VVVQDCRERATSCRPEKLSAECQFLILKPNDIGSIVRLRLTNIQQRTDGGRKELSFQSGKTEWHG
jgi:hypothetical protein